ncbi:MAG: ABC transporter substrate-binding protein [Xanthobacteraceae bacterium]
MNVNVDLLRKPIKDPDGLHPVTLAVADYDRTRPLIDGRVKPEGIALKTNTSWIGDFCVRPVYEEYDAAEMSLSWYVMARTRGEPVVALPVFPLRMPVLAYVFVRNDSGYTKPSDLAGKRIATILYRITVNLWLRGIFAEFYGIEPRDVEWVVTQGTEGAGFQMPDGIRVTKNTSATPEQLLERGEVDAIFLPELPEGWDPGHSKIRRLFPDTQAEMQSFVKRTNIFPITHTIVMKKVLAGREPWIARSLTRAFNDAQDVCDAHLNANPKHTSLPDTVFFLEEQQAAYGSKPYVQGIEPNRKVLETFVRYAHEQGYISRTPTLEELFPSFG